MGSRRPAGGGGDLLGALPVDGFAQPAAGNAHVSVSGSTVVALFGSHGRLGTRERRAGVWSLRFLTAAGAPQQAVAATSFRSAFTALGLNTSDRLYAITMQ